MIVQPKEYRLVRDVVVMLNEAYPTDTIKIPAQRWDEGKVVQFTTTPDPYFSAYKSENSHWWLCSTNIHIYREAYDYMADCCKLIKQETGFKASSCQVHVTYTAQLKREHKEKIKFFIGVCSWSEND